jgi:2-polyprenyl-3-methyl-5-hydroxy-6-metoxy-1,4-benzoquinol methylase
MDERYGAAYRTLYEQHWWWRARERLIVSTVATILPKDGDASMLDVGCGDGLLFGRLTDFGHIDGLESDARLITKGGPWEHRISIGEFDERFRPGKSYRLILMLDVLEHVENPAAFLARARDLLEPGGALLITVPAFRAIWTRHDDLNHHQTRYRKGTLLPLLVESGFTIERARYYFQWLFAVKLVVRLLERLRPGVPEVPRVPAHVVNEAVYRFSLAEQAIAGAIEVPFGSSLLVLARKPRSRQSP